MAAAAAIPAMPDPSADLLTELEGIYRDLHANPEL